MIVDATDKFARRVAEWLNNSTLSHIEMTKRLSQWPDTFINKVLREHRKLVNEKKRR